MFSFSAVSSPEKLRLPSDCEGRVWLHHTPNTRTLAPHRHAELEINLVTHGTATYLLRDRKHELRQGTLVWLFSGDDHVLLDRSPDFSMWIAVWTPAVLQRLCQRADTAPLLLSHAPPRDRSQLSDSSRARFEIICRDLTQAEGDPVRCNMGLGYLLLSLWDAHQKAEDAPTGRGVHPAVERAARLLRDETVPLSLDELADKAGLSTSRLSRLFHAQTGQSIVEFRNRRRMERFLRLRGENENATYLETALDAGFGSYAQFHRVFKETMGCRPTEYDKPFNMVREYDP